MAEIGMLGDIVFSISSREIKTIQSLSWSSSVRWHEHDRHLLPPILEFGGVGVDKITLPMTFSRYTGNDPMAEIAKLLRSERAGEVMRLIIGTHAYGTSGKWVIESSSREAEYFDSRGDITAALVRVNLLAYNSR